MGGQSPRAFPGRGTSPACLLPLALSLGLDFQVGGLSAIGVAGIQVATKT